MILYLGTFGFTCKLTMCFVSLPIWLSGPVEVAMIILIFLTQFSDEEDVT